MRCKAGMFCARIVSYDIGNASFTQSLSVAAQEGTPTGIAFSADGTKMFIVGIGGDDVNEYALSTAWDISTASYTQRFSVAADPQAIAFSVDGAKLFTVSNVGDAVTEYALSTAWDISTASYTQNFSVAAQDLNPTGLSFSGDGTRMYVSGVDGDDINEYALSTAWDISTASYTQNFSVNSEETIVNGVTFSADGTKMFIVGIGGDEVNEYALGTAWDISTASYTRNFSVASNDNTPRDLAFSQDGTRLYIIGDQFNSVYEYSLI